LTSPAELSQEDLGEQMTGEVRLRARPECELGLGRLELGDAPASLERRRALPVRAERLLDDGGGRGQRRRHVTMLEPARQKDVAARRLVNERRALTSGAQHIHRRRARLVLDAHQRGASAA
jgi:hypothetical protein